MISYNIIMILQMPKKMN